MGISKHDKQALSQLFIDMGVPLIVAMQTVESWSGDVVDLPKKAENLAKLLNTTVEFATNMIKKLEIRDPYTLENVRGKIIRVVTPIIAESYVAGGDMPEQSSLKDLTDLFDVLISFSDSVTPSDDDKSKPHDMAVIIDACEPVLSAIHEHSFGLGAEEVLKRIMDGLKGRADNLAHQLNVDDPIQGGLIKAVAKVYVSCYRSAMAKVESGHDMSGDAALEMIWTDCDERIALIHGLASYVGGKVGIETPKPEAVLGQSDKPSETEDKKDSKPDVASNTEAHSDDDDDGDDADFNPMSFFGAGG